MKKVVRLTESDIKNIICESVGHIYTEQWADETREFMDGLENGEAIVEDDIVYVQIMRRMTPKNDPRYVYFKRGDNRLHDDHFCMKVVFIRNTSD